MIYLGPFYPFQRMPEEESARMLEAMGMAPSTPFVMHLGGNNPTKNRFAAIHIFNALTKQTSTSHLHLILAGRPITPQMEQYIQEQGLQSRFRNIQHPNNEQIRALYSRAQALIFPSLHEGFGLPVLEGQACGCPVFTSNRAPMTEVGGEGAAYFDPKQPEETAEIVARGLERRAEMIALGYENIKRFTTEGMIDNYIQAYRGLLAPQESRAARQVA